MPRQRHYQNRSQGSETIFLTTTVLDFVQVFRDPEHVKSFICAMAEVFRENGGVLHAFVVMPEHVHLVLRLPPDQAASTFAGRLKSITGRALVPELSLELKYKLSQQSGLNRRTFWQRGFRSFPIESEEVFWQKVEYTHLNPVRRVLCRKPEDHHWSSARLFLAGGRRGHLEGIVIEIEGLAVSETIEAHALRVASTASVG